jgi:hypothetical protein
MAGFTRKEAEFLMDEALPNLEEGKADILNHMEQLCNGYKFSPYSTRKLFNSGSAIYFLENCARQRKPSEIPLDKSIISNYSKIKALATIHLGDTADSSIEQVAEAISHRLGILTSIAAGEPQPVNLTIAFELDKLDSDDFLSLLYYTGYLTYSSEDPNALVIPNTAMKDTAAPLENQVHAIGCLQLLRVQQLPDEAVHLPAFPRLGLPKKGKTLKRSSPTPQIRFSHAFLREIDIIVIGEVSIHGQAQHAVAVREAEEPLPAPLSSQSTAILPMPIALSAISSKMSTLI